MALTPARVVARLLANVEQAGGMGQHRRSDRMSTVLPITHRCTSCGRPILWAISAVTGTRMPIDPDPAIGGNVRLDDAHPPKARVVGPAIDLFDPTDDGTRYVSHFATCPTADTHRRRSAR